jgi:hypothetical protein
MNENPTPARKGPWQLLVYDHDTGDPKLILATVCDPADVEPAWRGPTDRVLELATAWLLKRTGEPGQLVPLDGAEVWRVDPHPSPEGETGKRARRGPP